MTFLLFLMGAFSSQLWLENRTWQRREGATATFREERGLNKVTPLQTAPVFQPKKVFFFQKVKHKREVALKEKKAVFVC